MSDAIIGLGEDLETKAFGTVNAAARIYAAKHAIAVYSKAFLESSYDTDRQRWIGRKIKRLCDLRASDLAALTEENEGPENTPLSDIGKAVDFYCGIIPRTSPTALILFNVFMKNYKIVMEYLEQNSDMESRPKVAAEVLGMIEETLQNVELLFNECYDREMHSELEEKIGELNTVKGYLLELRGE
jgi:hypothetical protein